MSVALSVMGTRARGERVITRHAEFRYIQRVLGRPYLSESLVSNEEWWSAECAIRHRMAIKEARKLSSAEVRVFGGMGYAIRDSMDAHHFQCGNTPLSHEVEYLLDTGVEIYLVRDDMVISTLMPSPDQRRRLNLYTSQEARIRPMERRAFECFILPSTTVRYEDWLRFAPWFKDSIESGKPGARLIIESSLAAWEETELWRICRTPDLRTEFDGVALYQHAQHPWKHQLQQWYWQRLFREAQYDRTRSTVLVMHTVPYARYLALLMGCPFSEVDLIRPGRMFAPANSHWDPFLVRDL